MNNSDQNVLLPAERQKDIYQYMMRHNSAKVNELAQIFKVSDMTIRRDLEELEKRKLVVRTHGGAILAEDMTRDLNVEEREVQQLDKKKRMAAKAKEFVEEGDLLALDASTSAAELAKLLYDVPNLTVVTNSLLVANIVQSYENLTLVLCGGIMRKEARSFIGPLAELSLSKLNFTKAFFSCNAIHPVKGMTDTNVFEITMKQLMIKRSKQAYALIDSSKFNKVAFSQVCPFADIAAVITDDGLDEEINDQYRQREIPVILAPPATESG
ncbi:DeoR/GlpR family DNA-binding transcription regulator [Brevibacillus centrosporus]|uniref:DeoR/GlpR family DNA-binding transcription regulator n=1 Tax=Brevibacillus centrosporus TaxID=54910 RepID=UPI002E1CBC37|nr:DeoR/GlpR family DNA-binding transcription regulator [Brevibacillus centrosporus]